MSNLNHLWLLLFLIFIFVLSWWFWVCLLGRHSTTCATPLVLLPVFWQQQESGPFSKYDWSKEKQGWMQFDKLQSKWDWQEIKNLYQMLPRRNISLESLTLMIISSKLSNIYCLLICFVYEMCLGSFSIC
jgi:hypothetical protein